MTRFVNGAAAAGSFLALAALVGVLFTGEPTLVWVAVAGATILIVAIPAAVVLLRRNASRLDEQMAARQVSLARRQDPFELLRRWNAIVRST